MMWTYVDTKNVLHLTVMVLNLRNKENTALMKQTTEGDNLIIIKIVQNSLFILYTNAQYFTYFLENAYMYDPA